MGPQELPTRRDFRRSFCSAFVFIVCRFERISSRRVLDRASNPSKLSRCLHRLQHRLYRGPIPYSLPYIILPRIPPPESQSTDKEDTHEFSNISFCRGPFYVHLYDTGRKYGYRETEFFRNRHLLDTLILSIRQLDYLHTYWC